MCPCRAHPCQTFGRRVDLCFRLPERSAGVIQIGICAGNGVRVILHCALIGSQLTFETLDLIGGGGIFFFQRIKVFLRGNGRRIVITELAPEAFILFRRGSNLVL